MKKFVWTMTASLLVLLAIGLAPVFSQEGGEEAPPEDPWAKLHTPGEEHNWLAEEAGDWEISGKMWGPGEDGKPVETAVKGSARLKMMFDRYLAEEMTITIGDSGVEMKMIGLIGYDNSAKEFSAMYVGNMGTGMHVFKGQRSNENKVITLSAEYVEKGLGDMKIKERLTNTRKSKDEALLEMWGTYGDMPEMKMMEVTYTRKK